MRAGGAGRRWGLLTAQSEFIGWEGLLRALLGVLYNAFCGLHIIIDEFKFLEIVRRLMSFWLIEDHDVIAFSCRQLQVGKLWKCCTWSHPGSLVSTNSKSRQSCHTN